MPYIESARLQTTPTGARLAVKPPLVDLLTKVYLRNDFDFKNHRPGIPLKFPSKPPGKFLYPQLVGVLNFDPSTVGIRSGETMHFEIILGDSHQPQHFEYAATYDPLSFYRDNAKWTIPVASAALVVGCFTLLLFTKPLWNLYLYRRLKLHKIDDISIPGVGDAPKVALKVVTILPWYVKHSRTLDAWIAHHHDRLAVSWNRDLSHGSPKDNLSTHYVQLPVRIGDQSAGTLLHQPRGQDFDGILDVNRWQIQIIGPGGAGKTTLARQIGHWALEGSVKGASDKHKMLPIWIDEELDGKNSVSKVVRGKLFAALSEEVESDFCDAMLSKQRLLIVVDRLSERSAAPFRA